MTEHLAAGIPGALAHIVAKLEAAGLSASHTIGGVQVPGVWVHATGYEPITIGRTARLTVAVDLIAPDHDEHTVLDTLDLMLGQALTAITPSGLVETDNAIEFPSGALPSFRIPTTIDYLKE